MIGPDATDAGGATRSLVDRIRARAEQRGETKDIAVPRYGGDVVVRFGKVRAKTINGVRGTNRVQAAKILVDSCREILIVNDAGDLVSIAAEEGYPDPVRFDGRLADLFELGRGDSSPVETALAFYADDVAVGAIAKRLFDWQTGADLEQATDDAADQEVDDLAGEADAAT